MMKILHVVNISFVLPYYIGAQFDHFKEQGVMYFVACSESEHLAQLANEKDFVSWPVPILRTINPIQDLKSIIYLAKKIRENKIDIVIGHTPKGGMIAMIASYLAGTKKRVYFRHGIMFETSGGFKRVILKNIERLTAALATTVVSVSQSVLEKSNQLRLNDSKKNLVLHRGTCNGIDIEKFNQSILKSEQTQALRIRYNIAKTDVVIGFVGRLVKDKGIVELIKAWRMLISEFKDIKLLLVGPYEQRDALDEETQKEIANSSTIVHTGLISDVTPLYGLMDIFILPSFREGFPTVVLEASAMELPIITTRSTGCKDSIVPNKTGLFTGISSEEIFETVKYYLLNPDIRKQHGVAGRSFVVENYRQEVVWEAIQSNLLNLNNE